MYLMRCLLCPPGSHFNPPEPGGHSNLVELQEHLMAEHEASQWDLRQQRLRTILPGVLEYTLPDGRTWLRAWQLSS